MGGLVSSGKSAAKRQAEAMRKQMEQDKQQFEMEQARLAEERSIADAQHQQMMAKQESQANATKLQAQIAEDNRNRQTDEVAEVTTDFEVGGENRNKKRKPLELTTVLGL